MRGSAKAHHVYFGNTRRYGRGSCLRKRPVRPLAWNSAHGRSRGTLPTAARVELCPGLGSWAGAICFGELRAVIFGPSGDSSVDTGDLEVERSMYNAFTGHIVPDATVVTSGVRVVTCKIKVRTESFGQGRRDCAGKIHSVIRFVQMTRRDGRMRLTSTMQDGR